MNWFTTDWTPAPSGWRSDLWWRVLEATRLIPGRPLEDRLLAWMDARGHLGTMHFRLNAGVILVRAAVTMLEAQLVTFSSGRLGDPIPTVVPMDYHRVGKVKT